MEEKYPDLFQEIEQRVKEGRWEIVGGMWVEPDLNMPTGESLTRQSPTIWRKNFPAWTFPFGKTNSTSNTIAEY